jgi:signal transduction histidine kinase
MLRFARREAHEVLPLNLHDAINDAIKIFEGAAPKNIRLLLNLDASVPMLSGDPNQIEQIVMNLLVNASDAMPDGGVITISTRLLTIEADRSKIPFIILPGRYVVLSISDTGTGIPQESLKKIFDPFFTTKDKGKGTGLGLATVYGIVKDHKGYIDVQTEIEKGTTFYIYFPAIERTAKQAAKLQNLE